MPTVEKTPPNLKPYLFHGVSLETRGDQAVGDCPFCGKDGKFSIELSSGKARCWSCSSGNEKGGLNPLLFLRRLWSESFKQTDEDTYTELSEDRGYLSARSLIAWEAARSILTGEWMLPAYSSDGKLSQVYLYRPDFSTRKRRLLATSDVPHGLFGVQLFDKSKKRLYFCESVWDAIAWWEMLGRIKATDSGLKLTGSESASLLADANVLASPGCNVFREDWCPFFSGKEVVLLCQSDYPNPNSGRSPGYEGMKRVAGVLARAAEKPVSISYLKWGENGYDLDQASGYDIRDALSSGTDLASRIPFVKGILDKVETIPQDWILGRTLAAKKKGTTEIELIPCNNWKDLEDAWRKAMSWTHGMRQALPAMLAVITSTRMPDSQLWLKLISPPSTGKTSLAEALLLNGKYTKELGNFRGFHSGYVGADRNMDHSLLPILKDKCGIIKDADTLLKAPNRDQIFAEMRDVYDTNSSANYRTAQKKDYKGYRFPMILCGTESLLELDAAELGARYLDCVIMEGIDDELETDVNRRKFFSVIRSRGVEANGDLESHRTPEMLRAMQMTAGYISYLRENATTLLSAIDDSNADELVDKYSNMAKFVAYMRSRPPKKQDEVTAREMSTRLNIQLTKLGLCLAVVLGKTKMDEDVMERVRKVALDTARGSVLTTCKHLYRVGIEGATTTALAKWTAETDDRIRKQLRHLQKIKAVRRHTIKNGNQEKVMCSLTPTLLNIFKEVLGNAPS